ncbi:MAG: ABC transporter substrate-binding protein, partial [Deinococcota bacterium]|nr:ABC transporter substrate-binding protein [Deinococcota bacterium]
AITFDQGISPTLQNRAAGRFDIWFVPSPVWEHLDVNQFSNVQQVADLQLNDVRTRQALLHSIDRDSMVEALFEGLQPVAHTNVNPVHPWFNEDVVQYPYDPERAAALFAELGWERGADGILQRTTEDGRTVRFELEFVTTAGNAVRERQQQFIAEDWQQAGVEVRINNAPAGVVFSEDFSSRAYEGAWTGVFMFAWVSSLASTANAEIYLCDSAPSPANSFAGQNYGGYCDPEYDEVRQRAVREFDIDAAAPIYRELQEVYANTLPAIPLFFRSTPIVTRIGLANFVTNTYANGFGYPPVEPWLVGWEQNGIEPVYNQADYALLFGEEQ